MASSFSFPLSSLFPLPSSWQGGDGVCACSPGTAAAWQRARSVARRDGGARPEHHDGASIILWTHTSVIGGRKRFQKKYVPLSRSLRPRGMFLRDSEKNRETRLRKGMCWSSIFYIIPLYERFRESELFFAIWWSCCIGNK